jgi:hypothetical protein
VTEVNESFPETCELESEAATELFPLACFEVSPSLLDTAWLPSVYEKDGFRLGILEVESGLALLETSVELPQSSNPPILVALVLVVDRLNDGTCRVSLSLGIVD